MNPSYNAIIAEIPEVDELKNVLADNAEKARAYESTIVVVYRQGRVDQLSEWCKGRLKIEKGE